MIKQFQSICASHSKKNHTSEQNPYRTMTERNRWGRRLERICLNARSIINKVDDLGHLLLSQSPQMGLITGTWLYLPGIADYEVIPPQYELVRDDGYFWVGSVALVVWDGMEGIPLETISGQESLFSKIVIRGVWTWRRGFPYWHSLEGGWRISRIPRAYLWLPRKICSSQKK